MTRTREVSRLPDDGAAPERTPRRHAAPRRARIAAWLGALALSTLFTVLLGSAAAFADDNDSDQGTGQVTISVTIGPFDPCAVHSRNCSQLPTLALPDPLGGLVASGSVIGLPLGAGVLLVAMGATVVVSVARRRRRSSTSF